MNSEKALHSFSITRIFCSVFGHKYRVSNVITNHIKEYKCRHCGEELTDTANGILAKLTPKFKETNAFLAQVHERRIRRKRTFSEAS
ncbi:hypothetical protein [Salinimicrobium sp. GXAS 041]|uniref:hypothetical protein n=1 Tax=Salinimicrobium sp. GXAS 041 TaxID=3400806 RepID=UPI003C76494D